MAGFISKSVRRSSPVQLTLPKLLKFLWYFGITASFGWLVHPEWCREFSNKKSTPQRVYETLPVKKTLEH